MKILLLLMIILTLSCQTGEEENIWDELTPEQQALVKTMARDRCLNDNSSRFDTLISFITQDFTTTLAQASTDLGITINAIEVNYTQEKQNEEGEWVVNDTEKFTFDIESSSVNGAVFKVAPDNKEVTYDLSRDTVNADLATATNGVSDVEDYLENLKVEVCDPTDEGIKITSVSNYSLIYVLEGSPSTQSGQTSYFTYTFTIDRKFPVFMEYFNVVKNTKIVFNDTSKATEYKRETWRPTYISTKAGASGSATCAFATSTDLDYEDCLEEIAEVIEN